MLFWLIVGTDMQRAKKMEIIQGFGALEAKVMEESFYVIYVFAHSKYDGTWDIALCV